MAGVRFRDEGAYLADFAGEVWVVCPACGERDRVTRRRPFARHEARFACARCGATRRGSVGDVYRAGAPVDPHLGLDLWLRTACKGEILWAWNPEHLEFLARFVAADLRETMPGRNGSLASRLPRWMTLARNRQAVLGAIRRLRSKVLRARREAP